MGRTIEEINEKIRKGNCVVLNAEEVVDYANENGIDKTYEHVDVVTTGTFGAMCSSGAFLNFGHSNPQMRMEKVLLNDVEAYAGLAAVDVYIGATQESDSKKVGYGGAHVIHDLISRKDVKLEAKAKGTDCYPRTEIRTYINIDEINEAYMYNPRNGYQNYPAATNSTNRVIKTYMGALLPNYGNINYSSAGELSPLLNDPYYRTLGVGTKVFFGGAQGYIAWEGTQHAPSTERNQKGIPVTGAGTVALIGNLKDMNPRYIKPAVIDGYGISIFIGFGLPIPIIDKDILMNTLITNKDIETDIVDYSVYDGDKPVIKRTNYAQLRKGYVEINGDKIKASPLSSLKMAREIANNLKEQIMKSEFLLTKPVRELPKKHKGHSLKIREAKK